MIKEDTYKIEFKSKSKRSGAKGRTWSECHRAYDWKSADWYAQRRVEEMSRTSDFYFSAAVVERVSEIEADAEFGPEGPPIE